MTDDVVLTREQSRFIDGIAMDKYAIPGIILMENAGSATARVIAERLKEYSEPHSVTIVTGKGNNGGDGFVVARHLHNLGVIVRILGINVKGLPTESEYEKNILAEFGERRKERIAEKYGFSQPPKAQPAQDAAINLRIVRRMELPILEIGTEVPLSALANHFRDTDIIVDALLGTGVRGAPRAPYPKIIEAINGSGKLVVAVDLPSGLDANTGETPGACVKADITVTFVAKKTGFLRAKGPQMCGELRVAEISVPKGLAASIAAGSEE